MRYNGPLIDAHTHLLSENYERYPWLKSENAFAPLEAWKVLQADYTLNDYRADAEGQNVVGSVHINADWTELDGPLAEIEWLESLDHSTLLIDRYVAGVAFGEPDSEQNVRDLAAFPRVVGIRQNIQWHPALGAGNKRPAEITRVSGWRDSIAAVEESGLLLEFILFPWQVDEVIEIATEHPELTIVVDHVLSPLDQSRDGVDQWRRAIERLARSPNVVVKLSSIQAYLTISGDRSDAAVKGVIDHVLDNFTSSRALFSSDYPVGKITGLTFSEVFEQNRRCVEDRSLSEQRELFFATAAKVYQFPSID